MRSIHGFITLIALLFLSAAYGQTNDAWFKAMQSAFEEADFEETIHHGNQLLKKDISENRREEVYRTLGVSFFHQTSLDSSRYYFLRLLSLRQDAALDPIKTSPKIIQYFEEIRHEYLEIRRLETPAKKPDDPPAEHLPPEQIKDIRPAAGLSSLILPGYGQWKKGHKVRSVISAVGFSALLGSTAVLWFSERDARDDYLNAKTFPAINELYDEYNSRQKKRKSLLLATGVFWGLSVIDAFWSPYAMPEIESDVNGNLRAGIRMRF